MERGSRDEPVYVRAVSDRDTAGGYLTALEVVNKTVMTAYAVVMAWQVAKIVCPPLQVQEDIAKAWLRHRWDSRRKAPEVHVPHSWTRDVYDSTREAPGGC